MAQTHALVRGVKGQDRSYRADLLLALCWVIHRVGRQAQSRWIGRTTGYSYHALDLNDAEVLSALRGTRGRAPHNCILDVCHAILRINPPEAPRKAGAQY